MTIFYDFLVFHSLGVHFVTNIFLGNFLIYSMYIFVLFYFYLAFTFLYGIRNPKLPPCHQKISPIESLVKTDENVTKYR